MKITRDIEYRDKLLTEQRGRMGVDIRRSGTHVSDLIFCVRKAWAERQPGVGVNPVSDQTILTWLRGLSHEALLADDITQVAAGHCFACQKTWQQAELVVRSQGGSRDVCPDCGDSLLTGTIDWISLVDDDPMSIESFIPVEMKSTLKSSRKTLEEGEMLWFVDQIKSYMWMHQQPTGRICILHNMGDYSRGNKDARSEGPSAELRVYRLEWDSDEERDAWGYELEVSKLHVEDPLHVPVLDSRSPRHEFICDYCIVGELLPSGVPCEKFPWTPDGYRKGSKLAETHTLDGIQKELDALMAMGDNNVDATEREKLIDCA